MKKIFLKPVVVAASLSAILLMNSCGHDSKHAGLEFMPDMYRSPSYETYQPNSLFKDSSSARLPVAGTIPRGFNTYFPYPNTAEGYEAAGAGLKNPLAMNDVNLKEGDRLFHIFCQHCHGEKGDGQGTLKVKGEKFPVPSYFDDAHISLPEGKMYFTIMYGKNLMGSHASQIDPDQRWKIIEYIKSLQAQALAEKSKQPSPVKAESSSTAMRK